MKLRRFILSCFVILGAGRSQAQSTFLIDNFDDPSDARVTGRTITPDQTGFLSGGDMFGPAERGALLPNTQTLPFAISDDSEVAAAGNSAFQFDIQGIFGKAKADTDSFFGVVDLANPQNTPGTGDAQWTINTSGLTNLSLTVDVGAMGDFEATGATADKFQFSVSFNGGSSFTPVMIFATDEAVQHTYREMDASLPSDSDFDESGTVDFVDYGAWKNGFGTFDGTTDPVRGVGNANGDSDVDGADFLVWQRELGESGSAHTKPTYQDPLKFLGADGVLGGTDDVVLDKADRITGKLDTFTVSIPGTGATMILKFDATNDGGDEAFAFDNLKLTGTGSPAIAAPEPGALCLTGCALAALAFASRRR
jgi:hypothetical protein